MTVRYVLYYIHAALAIFTGTPVLDPNDPLERSGSFDIQRIVEQVAFGDDDTVIIDAELFIPIDAAAAATDTVPESLVLFMPGFGSGYGNYMSYIEHMTSHGMVVIGMDFAAVSDSRFFFSEESGDGQHDILAQQAIAVLSFVRNKYVEYSDVPVYTAGHSLGGKIAFFVAALLSNSSIRGVMALDPVNAGGGPCLLFPNQCTNDPVAPNTATGQVGILSLNNNTQQQFRSVIFRSRPDILTNPSSQFNADNFFLGTDGMGLYGVPAPVWYYDFGSFPHALYASSSSEQHQIMKRTMIAFLRQDDISNAEQYLTGDIIQNDIAKKRLVSVQTRL